MQIRINTDRGWVSEFNEEHMVVSCAKDRSLAQVFKSRKSANKWLDDHCNAGYGLSWSDNPTYDITK